MLRPACRRWRSRGSVARLHPIAIEPVEHFRAGLEGRLRRPTATTSPLRGLCLKQALRCEGTEATQLDTRAARQSSGDLLEYVATVSSAMYRRRFLGHRIEPYAGLGWRLKLGLTEHVGQ